jgi:hypothetical protein
MDGRIAARAKRAGESPKLARMAIEEYFEEFTTIVWVK